MMSWLETHNSKCPKIEASHYINKVDFTSKIPYLGRENSVSFIDALYKRGAFSVVVLDVKQTGGTSFITEIQITVSSLKQIRNVVRLIFKSNPSFFEEVNTRVFKIGWNLKV